MRFASIQHNIEYEVCKGVVDGLFHLQWIFCFGLFVTTVPPPPPKPSHILQTKTHSSRFTANIIIAFLNAIPYAGVSVAALNSTTYLLPGFHNQLGRFVSKMYTLY